MSNVVTAVFGGFKTITTSPKYQYDYGQMLVLKKIPLPDAYEVHFSNEELGQAKKVIGDANGVMIPDEYFLSGQPIYAWLFLHDTVTDGYTLYTAKIPIIKRARPIDTEPTPVQQDIITQAIAVLNTAAETAETNAQLAEESAQRAEQSEQNALISAESAGSYDVSARGHADRASAAQSAARQAAEDADGHAHDAEHYADLAGHYADLAEQGAATAGYMQIEMDDRGHLIYTRTDAVDVDFRLDENGHLIMEAI